MRHRAHPDFWHCHRRLTTDVQRLAEKSFGLLQQNSRHPSVRLKKTGEYWSARVGLGHLALAIEVDEGLMWVWIGAHDEYQRFIDS